MQKTAFTLYDASAGSGKTFTLVKEYLKILLTSPKNDAYRNILAITFTNKAVGEMKSRIVSSLSEFAKDEPGPKAVELMEVIQQETALNAIDIKIKARQIIKNIIHNYASFDISTIDKFTHKVIRAFAHDLGLPITFDVSLETDNLLTEAVDAIIAQAGEDETLTRLLVDFTMEKTDDDKSWDVTREILDTGKLLLNENNRNEIVHFQDKTISEFVEIKKKIQQVVTDLDAECAVLAQEAIAVITAAGVDEKSFSGGYFPKHLQSIKEGRFNAKNKTYHEAEDIKINKTAKDKEIIEGIIPELLSLLERVYKNQEKMAFYMAFLKNITPLSLLNTVSQELSKIQKEQNILSISEFNAIIYKEIQNQPAPFIYERLGEKYKHFFIDEFQDTSEMQWQNLIPLIDNALSSEDLQGERGSLMIVGDPKQSIYRWRGGKAEQFIELSKEHNPFNNPDKKIEHLDRNFRSYSEIIQFNNGFFKMISEQFTNPDYKNLYENHSHQEHNSKIGGYINISFLPKIEKTEGDDEETPDKTRQYVQATLVAIKKSLAQGFEYKDIAILTRRRDQGIAVAGYLTEQGIPILSSETLMIENATEVIFILNVLRYLNNSSNLEAKAYLLQYIGEYVQKQLPVHDFIFQGMENRNEKEFENWLMSFDISLSFQELRRKSLYEAVESIISKFINLKQNNAYIQYFLDLVLERDIKNQAGITDFLSYWEKNGHKFSIPSPEGKNAVRILTIHKSKGLEFPVVIFPFAEEDYSRRPKDKLWLDSEDNISELPRVLIDNSSAVEGFGEEASLVYQQKKQEDLLDNVNVLYVALTRAEEQLYIISSMNLSAKGELPKNNMALFFINYLEKFVGFDIQKHEYEIGSPERISRKSPIGEEARKIPFVREVLDPKNIKIAQRESLMWGTHQQKAIEYGNIVHEILSYIGNASDVGLALTKAIENGLIVESQQEEVAKTISLILGHPELMDYFAEGNNVMNEQTIIRKEGTPIKPDRMVMAQDNKVYLLDYKTGSHNQKYLQQLEAYEQAIEKMGYQVAKKALVYIGEEVNVVNL
ncbi:UvrD-helicase domain-containing protein [Flavobacterium lindanitolerans]|uniref:DNA 3'-5' helicase n=1 Tax=Flavobacterium lindanitolerans TaxID=428988 RepID=A0A497V3V0_9FLAO|nr:UvrD-helicase domain-containing protein [Flavobacterium lindanitolerans]PKW29090.1 ATP-dependent exoDNAse (exonuclease V) beta subunit [Flavobacterium lindanitolerans]RLJ35408.1 ATP-dependent exoDNAse (exonuclease V) beta subunit [Flavobacterium lindanitolerans]